MTERVPEGDVERPFGEDTGRADDLGADAVPADSGDLAMDDVEGGTVAGPSHGRDEWSGEDAGDDLH